MTCPNPTHAMRYDGARWSRTCPCTGCVEQRAEYFPRSSRHANARHFDLDEMSVERAVQGDPPAQMTKAERLEAARRLWSRGVSAREIARILRISRRSIERYRSELGNAREWR